MKWIASLFCLLINSQLLAFELPADFQASYLTEKYGSVVAKTYLAKKTSADLISYTSSSEAVGLAAMFTSDRITETSSLQIKDPHMAPYLLGYNYSRKDKSKYNQHIKTSWDEQHSATIQTSYRNKRNQLTATHPVWDKLSVQLALMNDIKQAKIHDTLNYKVIDKNAISDYSFEYLGEEKIDINDKTYQTRKLKRIHSSGKRVTIMWLAPELAYLPVAIEQHKDNDLHWIMKIQDINIEAN